jgi:hypothetical protein
VLLQSVKARVNQFMLCLLKDSQEEDGYADANHGKAEECPHPGLLAEGSLLSGMSSCQCCAMRLAVSTRIVHRRAICVLTRR